MSAEKQVVGFVRCSRQAHLLFIASTLFWVVADFKVVPVDNLNTRWSDLVFFFSLVFFFFCTCYAWNLSRNCLTNKCILFKTKSAIHYCNSSMTYFMLNIFFFLNNNVGEGRAGMCVFGGDAMRLGGAKWMIYALLSAHLENALNVWTLSSRIRDLDMSVLSYN